MKSTVTHALLCRLTNTINNGQPIWGLFWANEYRDELGQVHQALVKKAQHKMEELKYERLPPVVISIAQHALSGTRLSLLEFNARRIVQKLEHPNNQSKRRIISMSGRRTKRYHLELPGQSAHSPSDKLKKSIGI